MRKKVLIPVIAVIVILLAYLGLSIKIIQPATVGVVVTMGRFDKQIESGVHFVPALISNVYHYDLRIQAYGEDTPLAAYSKDTQTVDYELSVQYRLDPARISDVYMSMGSDYKSRIAPLIAESSKSVFSMYTADQIVSNRNKLSEEMLESTRQILEPYHIIVTEVALAEIDFSDEYEAAIERKQIASQDVLTERHLLEKIQIQGDQSIAKAKADAEVQRLKEETLTDKILQQQAIDKWDGKLPQYFSGNELPFIAISPKDNASVDSNNSPSPSPTPVPTPTPSAAEIEN